MAQDCDEIMRIAKRFLSTSSTRSPKNAVPMRRKFTPTIWRLAFASMNWRIGVIATRLIYFAIWPTTASSFNTNKIPYWSSGDYITWLRGVAPQALKRNNDLVFHPSALLRIIGTNSRG